MKIDKISDTSIEFILTLRELKEKNIDIEKLSSEDIYVQKVVANLIEEAEIEHSISIKNNGKFKIYITSNGKDELSIVISSFDPYSEKYNLYEQITQQLMALDPKMNYLQNYSATSVEDKLKAKMGITEPNIQTPQKNSKSIIYCFNNLSDIKMALSDLDIKFKNEILYRYKNKYYLILYFIKNVIDKKKTEVIFGEYAILVNQSSFELILQEYGEKFIKANARKIIDLYY